MLLPCSIVDFNFVPETEREKVERMVKGDKADMSIYDASRKKSVQSKSNENSRGESRERERDSHQRERESHQREKESRTARNKPSRFEVTLFSIAFYFIYIVVKNTLFTKQNHSLVI